MIALRLIQAAIAPYCHSTSSPLSAPVRPSVASCFCSCSASRLPLLASLSAPKRPRHCETKHSLSGRAPSQGDDSEAKQLTVIASRLTIKSPLSPLLNSASLPISYFPLPISLFASPSSPRKDPPTPYLLGRRRISHRLLATANTLQSTLHLGLGYIHPQNFPSQSSATTYTSTHLSPQIPPRHPI